MKNINWFPDDNSPGVILNIVLIILAVIALAIFAAVAVGMWQIALS